MTPRGPWVHGRTNELKRCKFVTDNRVDTSLAGVLPALAHGSLGQKHRDALVLEERRLKGFEFLHQGARPAEVAGRLAVTPPVVYQQRETFEANGPHALRAKPRVGRHRFVEP